MGSEGLSGGLVDQVKHRSRSGSEEEHEFNTFHKCRTCSEDEY